MKREKTVIDVEVSEEKQREIVSSLLREHTNVGMKFERERTRQEEMVSPVIVAPLRSTSRRASLNRSKKSMTRQRSAKILVHQLCSMQHYI